MEDPTERQIDILVYYTQVCAPCNDQTYHYYETKDAVLSSGFELDERYISASKGWERQALAFKAALPILYSPKHNTYLSIGTSFNRSLLDQFLKSLS